VTISVAMRNISKPLSCLGKASFEEPAAKRRADGPKSCWMRQFCDDVGVTGVIDDTDHLWAEKMGVAQRCAYVAGDMFQKVPTADAYLLKHVLHDWSDAECAQVLTNMQRAAPPNARAFVLEFVVPGPEMPYFAKLFDIHMMCVVTAGSARKNGEGGWSCVKAWYPESKLIGVLEAVKA
jgi:hypothetical protein